MFRPIGGVLKKREQELYTRKRGAQSVAQVVAKILVEYQIPQEILTLVSVVYTESRKEVVIDTPSKSIAHQLIMSSLEIKSLLREEGFQVSSLVIR